MSDFHFLRPWMLLLFIPFTALSAAFWYYGPSKSMWHKICHKELLPYILKGQNRKSFTPYLLALAHALLILALAGPSFQKIAVPLVTMRSGVVIALDLSPSMDARDIKPSRLKRAIYKINDFLDRRKDGQTALIVFSQAPYVVTPMTTDVATIKALLPALETSIMPKAGHDATRALAKAAELLSQAGVVAGHILLITSELSHKEMSESIAEARKNGIAVSVLGVGTDENAPIILPDGGYLSDNKGALVLAKLNKDNMHALAKGSHGSFAMLAHDDSDIELLMATLSASQRTEVSQKVQYASQDQGYWLLLFGLPLISLLFRRGFVLPLLLLLPQGIQAYSWQDLWSTSDQQAEAHFHKAEYQAAKEKFQQPDWLGAVNYRLGDYEAAAHLYQQKDTPESQYNYATAKARAGDLKSALKAYEHVLASHPNHADALYNKKVIEDFLKAQQPQSPEEKNSKEQSKPSEHQEQAEQDGEKQAGENNAAAQDQAQPSADDQKQKPSHDSRPSKESQDALLEGDPKDDDKAEPQNSEQTPSQAPTSEMQEKYRAEMDAQLQAAEEAPSKEEMTPEQEMTRGEEMRQIDDRWLKRVEDRPGELLRRKFLYQYKLQNR